MALAALYLVGCGKLGGAQIPVSSETEALRQYSEASAQTRDSRNAVIEAWKALTQTKTADIFQQILGQRVLPKFEIYLSTARSIESSIPLLNQSHKKLVAAYEQVYSDLVDLEKTIPTLDRALSNTRLQDIVGAWTQAEQRYWNSVEKIYGQHGFLLEPRNLKLEKTTSSQ